MKKMVKWYLLLYSGKHYNQTTGWQWTLSWDKVKHGFAGDFVKLAIFLYFGIRNNFGENLLFNSDTMWWLYYILIPILFAFFAGFFKEAYDQQRGGKFDWKDVWATTMPFAFTYLLFKTLLQLVAPKLMNEIEEEVLNGKK